MLTGALPMRMQALILATLAAAGCSHSSIEGCDPGDEDFTVAAASLREQDVQDLIVNGGLGDRGEITCESACHFAYARDRGWEATDYTSCELDLDPEPGAKPGTAVGTVTCAGHGIEYYCEGRRPIGHVEPAVDDVADPLAAHLARAAHLEAASVIAFTQLAARLARWGAPAALIDRCRRAAADERRHAALLGALVERAGARVPPALSRADDVSLVDAALDNAVEGCVHEAWSALRAAWVARHADDPELRGIYTEIAADEAGHAQLAWDLHTWFLGQVDTAARARVVAARRAAITRLPQLARGHTLPRAFGSPDPTLARRFARGLEQAA